MLWSGFLRLECSLVVQGPIDYLVRVMQQNLGAVSPPASGSSWMDWSHAWRGEMCLKKVLKKLNLEYPCDSDD